MPDFLVSASPIDLHERGTDFVVRGSVLIGMADESGGSSQSGRLWPISRAVREGLPSRLLTYHRERQMGHLYILF